MKVPKKKDEKSRSVNSSRGLKGLKCLKQLVTGCKSVKSKINTQADDYYSRHGSDGVDFGFFFFFLAPSSQMIGRSDASSIF